MPRRPPITVPAPAKHPQCKGCERTLKPDFRTIYEERQTPTGFGQVAIERRFQGWLGPGFDFCTYRCALLFAARAHEAGFRWRKR